MAEIEMIGGSGEQPRLSDAAIESYRTFLADRKLADEHPEYFAKMKGIIDNALSVTGQSLEPAPDGRSPPQAYFDRSHAMQMDPIIANNIAQELKASTPPNPTTVKDQIEATGRSYPECLELAKFALEHAGQNFAPVEKLSSISLAQAANHGVHLRKHLPNRPA